MRKLKVVSFFFFFFKKKLQSTKSHKIKFIFQGNFQVEKTPSISYSLRMCMPDQSAEKYKLLLFVSPIYVPSSTVPQSGLWTLGKSFLFICSILYSLLRILFDIPVCSNFPHSPSFHAILFITYYHFISSGLV